jgi:hypothetical protein
MLYFHGLLLEHEQSKSNHHSTGLLHHVFHRRALAGDELDPVIKDGTKIISFEDERLLSLKPTAVSRMLSSIVEKPQIQWDLFGQSCSMIIGELLCRKSQIYSDDR